MVFCNNTNAYEISYWLTMSDFPISKSKILITKDQKKYTPPFCWRGRFSKSHEFLLPMNQKAILLG